MEILFAPAVAVFTLAALLFVIDANPFATHYPDTLEAIEAMKESHQ